MQFYIETISSLIRIKFYRENVIALVYMLVKVEVS
jgi:hypothetical protein